MLPVDASIVVDAESAVVSYRPAAGEERSTPAAKVSLEALLRASPWRTFRSYSGQLHYPGTYWSSTQRGHVIYESRLELANLLLADYDQGVREISAQPFLLRAAVEGREFGPTFRTIYSMATVDPLWWMSFVGNGCRIRKSASCVHGPVR